MKKEAVAEKSFDQAVEAFCEQLLKTGAPVDEVLADVDEKLCRPLSAKLEMKTQIKFYAAEYDRREAIEDFENVSLQNRIAYGWIPIGAIHIVPLSKRNDNRDRYAVSRRCWRVIKTDGCFHTPQVYCSEEDTWLAV